MKYFIISLLASLLVATSAHAQRFETYQINQRLNQIEQTLGALQSQGGPVATPTATSPQNASRLGAEIARLDEQMRQLRGQIEQIQYQIDQTQKQLSTLQSDTDYRFQQQSNTTPVAPPQNYSMAPSQPQPLQPQPIQPQPQPQQPIPLTEPAPSPTGQLALPSELNAETPRALYNQAFALLNQTNYDGAELAFGQFTQKFNDDPLIGNAWYWLGETHYVRRDYVKAADSFRRGFETLPSGPKAGDNLLKLAMSLSAMQRDSEACVVLRQVEKKYASNSSTLKEKAVQEINRLGCS